MQLTVGNGRVEAVGLGVVFEGGRKQRTVGGDGFFSKNAVIYDIYGEFAGNFDFFAGHLWVTYGSSMARPSVIYGVPGAVGRAGGPGPGQRGSVIWMSARVARRSSGGPIARSRRRRSTVVRFRYSDAQSWSRPQRPALLAPL